MKKQQTRTLGAFEKTFWLLDQVDSKDFALAGVIEGREPVEKWRKAINAAQERHPNLSVRISIDSFNRPILEPVESLEIPLRVVNADENYRWEDEVEKELAKRFNTAEGPLLRVVLIQKPKETVLILAANHTLADGASVNYLIRDILTAVSGQQLSNLNPPPANDHTLGLAEDVEFTDVEIPSYEAIELAAVAPKVSTIRFTSEQSQAIAERARAEKTTVHGAICAAVIISSRKMRTEWADKKMELVSPICARGALKLDDNFGLNITTHSVYFEGEQDLPFWDIARMAKDGLAGTDTAEHVSNYIQFFRGFIYNSPDLQKMVDTLKEAFNQEIMVTNLGKLKYATDFGNLKLREVYGPMVRSGKGQEQTIGATSTNGSICLANTSESPIIGLLQAVQQVMVEASEVLEDVSLRN